MKSMSHRERFGHGIEWLQPIGLAALFLVLAAKLPPAVLGEVVSAVFLAVIVVSAAIRLRSGRKRADLVARYGLDFIVIAIVSLVLSSLYWYRVAFAMTGWDYIGFRIVTGLAWWLPAVAFAALYRHPGAAWSSQGRGRFFARLLVAAVAALPGLPIQDALHDQRAAQAQQVGPTAASPSPSFPQIPTRPATAFHTGREPH